MYIYIYIHIYIYTHIRIHVYTYACHMCSSNLDSDVVLSGKGLLVSASRAPHAKNGLDVVVDECVECARCVQGEGFLWNASNTSNQHDDSTLPNQHCQNSLTGLSM